MTKSACLTALLTKWVQRIEETLMQLKIQISEREEVEKKLRENQAKLQAIIDYAVDAIVTCDEKGVIQSFSRSAETIFGYTKDEIIGQNISVLMPEPDNLEHAIYVRNYLESGQKNIIGIEREVQGKRKDGSVFPMSVAISDTIVGGAACVYRNYA